MSLRSRQFKGQLKPRHGTVDQERKGQETIERQLRLLEEVDLKEERRQHLVLGAAC